MRDDDIDAPGSAPDFPPTQEPGPLSGDPAPADPRPADPPPMSTPPPAPTASEPPPVGERSLWERIKAALGF
jgi:hypothetical protein